MKKRIISCFAAFLVASLPSFAVFNERDISKTISVLKQELKIAYANRQEQAERKIKESAAAEDQHLKMLQMTERCNELALVLYSQEIDFTFDITYALDKVREEYESFKSITLPHVDNIADLNTEIDRYDKLVNSLMSIPPVHKSVRERSDSAIVSEMLSACTDRPAQESWNLLKLFRDLQSRDHAAATIAIDSTDVAFFVLDEATVADRDTCVALANVILRSYQLERDKIIMDDENYAKLSASLDQAYEYAMSRFQVIQDNIYVKGQGNYFKILTNLKSYCREASDDVNKRLVARKESAYSSNSEWNGLILLQTMFYSVLYFLEALILFIGVFYGMARWVKRFRTPEFKRIRPYVTVLCAVVCVAILAIVAIFGPMGNFAALAAKVVLLYLWLLISVLVSAIIGIKGKNLKIAIYGYAPFLVLSLLVMLSRMLFVPDKVLNLQYTPLLIIFLIWQVRVCLKLEAAKFQGMFLLQQRLTCAIIVISLVIAAMGYVLLCLQVLLWWSFQLSFIVTIAALDSLVRRYHDTHLKKDIAKYMSEHKMAKDPLSGDCIRITWLYDFIKMALLPALSVLSLIVSVRWATNLFNLDGVRREYFTKPFINLTNAAGDTFFQLSMSNLLSVIGLFILFRYLNYVIRSSYKVVKLESLMRNKGRDIIKANEVNLTLANNVIGILTWGLFLIYAIYIIKLPVGALSAIFAGLAAGIGLALKDVLNNFIYGIQLMSGRLRVGDIVECDGIRGTVSKISYQTTDIQTFCGPVISFTNTNLFNRSFQNITKVTPYEYTWISVGISYSSDFDVVRKLLTEALKPKLKEKDKLGRYLVDQNYGIAISFGEFQSSSITVDIKQSVLTESKFSYISEVKEMIFKLFRENGIEIPFDQNEILIKNLPVESK